MFEEWQILYQKVFRILADNGSNMIGVFKADRKKFT